MKQISMIIITIAFAFACNAQADKIPPYQKTDTARVDSSQVKKIQNMPMDTLNIKLSPSPPDTAMHKHTGDDADPKRVDPKKKEY